MQKTILIITDGIGYSQKQDYNAFYHAKKPHYDYLFQNIPNSLIRTYGLSVGLPDNQMGNSEVGHMSLGSGRVLFQDLVKINNAIEDKSLETNAALNGILDSVNILHLAILASDGGVHSHINHLKAVATIAQKRGKKVWLHLITDGRDVKPQSFLGYFESLQDILCDEIKVATISGRFYAMDRDKRWDRIECAYKSIANGANPQTCSIESYIEKSYEEGVYDEFILPASFNGYGGFGCVSGDDVSGIGRQPNVVGCGGVGADAIDSKNSLHNGVGADIDSVKLSNQTGSSADTMDSVNLPQTRAGCEIQCTIDSQRNLSQKEGFIFLNYRSDRAREIVAALGLSSFSEFQRDFTPNLNLACMCEYDEKFNFPILFPKDKVSDTLAEILSKEGLRQAHIAETEKYAHVTFFFNGGKESEWEGEKRILIESPKVKTYDLKPEMSAKEVGDSVCECVKEGYDFIVVNFANGDMVGHTGNYEAAVRAVEAVDSELKKIWNLAKDSGYSIVLTSDHGNCEEMKDSNLKPLTNHTIGDVFCFVDSSGIDSISNGALSNIAPTILKIMGLPIPQCMDKALF